MNRQMLDTYLGHFNNRRYDEQAKLYAPHVSFELPTLTLRGPEAIIGLYKEFHPCVSEHVEIEDIIFGDGKIFAIVPTRFDVHKDFKKYGLNFEAGKRYDNVSFVLWEHENGMFTRIRSARQSSKVSDISR